VRRAHHEDDLELPLGESLLGAPYDETTAEEGEPLPACERYWPAALIPYLHPATMVAEQSMYWEADPADEVALLVGGADAASDAGSAPAEWDDGGRDDVAAAGGADTGSATPSSGRAPPSAPVAVPAGGRSGSWSAALAASAPHGGGAAASSYDSGGGGPESFRCGTALRFYRSSSASALKGMLEAAIAQQQQQQMMWQEAAGGVGSLGATGPPLAGGTPVRGGLARRPSGSGSFSGATPPPPLRPAPSPAPPPRDARPHSPAKAAGGRAKRGAPAARSPQPRPKPARGGGVGASEARAARGACPFITYAVAIVVCMAGSLAVWPGVTAFICSVHNPAVVSPCAPRAAPYGRLAGDLFVPAMFVIYALGDVTGRIASSWGPWGRRPPAAASLLAYSLARLGVVGALLVCHVVTPAPWQLPYLLTTDWWPLGLVLALGLTQGHLLSTACMHAPAVLPPGKEARFGPVTGFCITAGCLAGSVASTVIVEAFTAAPASGGGAPAALAALAGWA
jgi:hypothetical protein